MRRFIAYCDDVGQTKTLAVERILDSFLDDYETEKQASENNKPRS